MPHLPNQYQLATSSSTLQPPPAHSHDPSRTQQGGGSRTVQLKPINTKPINETNITTNEPPENFKNSELKLTAEQSECFEWAKENDYWHLSTSTIEEFLLVYNNPFEPF